jgi:hypothetical protein
MDLHALVATQRALQHDVAYAVTRQIGDRARLVHVRERVSQFAQQVEDVSLPCALFYCCSLTYY